MIIHTLTAVLDDSHFQGCARQQSAIVCGLLVTSLGCLCLWMRRTAEVSSIVHTRIPQEAIAHVMVCELSLSMTASLHSMLLLALLSKDLDLAFFLTQKNVLKQTNEEHTPTTRHTHAHARPRTHAHAHACTHSRTRAHIHTHTHTHVLNKRSVFPAIRLTVLYSF